MEKFFNANGLRFDTEYLKMIKSKIHKFSNQELAEYVDAITYSMVLRGKPIVRPEDLQSINANHFNATSVGNVAYIHLYHPDDQQRALAGQILRVMLTQLARV